MRIHIFLFIALMSLAQLTYAQQYKRTNSEIEAQKVAYITSKIQLTAQEAQEFWPIYNEYQAELEKLNKRQKSMQGKKTFNEEKLSKQSESEKEKQILESYKIEHQKIDLKERYFERYKKVLSVSKIAEFYHAEESFKRQLLRSLRENRVRQ